MILSNYKNTQVKKIGMKICSWKINWAESREEELFNILLIKEKTTSQQSWYSCPFLEIKKQKKKLNLKKINTQISLQEVGHKNQNSITDSFNGVAFMSLETIHVT